MTHLEEDGVEKTKIEVGVTRDPGALSAISFVATLSGSSYPLVFNCAATYDVALIFRWTPPEQP